MEVPAHLEIWQHPQVKGNTSWSINKSSPVALPSPYRNSSAMAVLLSSLERLLQIKVHTKPQSFVRKYVYPVQTVGRTVDSGEHSKSLNRMSACLPSVGICENSLLDLQLQVRTELKHSASPECMPAQQLFLPFQLCENLGESSPCLWASSSQTCILPKRMKHAPVCIISPGSNQTARPGYSREST